MYIIKMNTICQEKNDLGRKRTYKTRFFLVKCEVFILEGTGKKIIFYISVLICQGEKYEFCAEKISI